MRVQDYKLRFLGSWDYKDLTSLVCISGRYDLNTTSVWLELVVANKGPSVVCSSVKRFTPKSVDEYIRGAVMTAYLGGSRMGKWLIDGGNPSISLYDALSLV